MDIVVYGWYHHLNIGDESYKISIPKAFPQHKFYFTNNFKDEYKDKCVILGGGNVVTEDFVRPLKDVQNKYCLSVNADLNNYHLFKEFKFSYVRDLKSFELLQSKGIKNCKYIPDISTCLSGDPNNGRALVKKFYDDAEQELYSKLIVVIVNGHLVYGKPDLLARDYLTFFKFSQDLAKTMDETSASFLFLPMSTKPPWDDRITNSWVSSRCKFWKKNHVLYDKLSVQSTLDIISCADLVISTRLHSSIFSCTSGVPFIDVLHHDKNKVFIESIKQEKQTLSYWNFDSIKLNGLIKNSLDNDGLKLELQSTQKDLRGKLDGVLNEISFS